MTAQQPQSGRQKSTTQWLRKPCGWLLLITVFAFLVRLGLAHVAVGGLGRPYEGDECSYTQLAAALADGRGYISKDGTPHTIRTPAVPVLISLVFRLTDSSNVVVRVVMCLLATLLVPVCYLLGRSLADERVGLLSAIAAALFPNWIWFSSYILTDLLAAASIVLLVWALVEGWRRDSLSWFMAAGLLGGGGILVRATNMVFVPGIIFWIFLVMPTWRRRFVAAILVCVSLACVVAPWSIRNSLAFGRFASVSTQGGVAFWIGNNPEATGVLTHDFGHWREVLSKQMPREDYANSLEWSEACKAKATQFIRENPGRFLRLCTIRFVEFWKIYSPRVPLHKSLMVIASFGVLLPFAILQVIRRGWCRGPEMLLVILIASQTAVHTVFTAIIRYRIPIEPLVVILAASGLVWLLDRWRASSARV